MSGNTPTHQMPSTESERLIAELTAYCDKQGFGARSRVAKALGVTRQQLTNWLTGFRKPGVDWHFKIRAFLDRAGDQDG